MVACHREPAQSHATGMTDVLLGMLAEKVLERALNATPTSYLVGVELLLDEIKVGHDASFSQEQGLKILIAFESERVIVAEISSLSEIKSSD